MRHGIFWALIPILSMLYQLFLKLAAQHMEPMDVGLAWLAQAATTPWMWAALLCEALAFMVWMQILSKHDLSKAFPLTAISYVLILGISWAVFHESIVPLQWLGSALILAGVWLIGTAHPHRETTG